MTSTVNVSPVPGLAGRYRIEAQVGAGAMGVVYRAYDTRLERTVAIKLVTGRSVDDDAVRRRILDEARAASRLNHPNICTVYEVGAPHEQPYIVMEYVSGESLTSMIPVDGLPIDAVVRYARQIAGGLAHAHDHGVVHRDLKSANIMITADGRPKVLDFGVARVIRSEPSEAPTEAFAQDHRVAGTLAYMAPEVLRADPATTLSDVWSLGVLMHEMATGRVPFAGRTPYQLASAILQGAATPLPPRVPAGLQAVIGRCLSKEPGQRYQRTQEIAAALEAIQMMVGLFPAIVPPLGRKDDEAAHPDRIHRSSATCVLVVEDEPGLSVGLADDLKLEGYGVEIVTDGETAIHRALQSPPDLIVLDVMLPRRDGFEVCRTLRRSGLTVPIILLTAKNEESDRVLGLELGADDYVTKPFSPRELRARVRAALRRAGSDVPALYRADGRPS